MQHLVQPVRQLFEMLIFSDERWCQKEMCPFAAIHRATSRVTDQTVSHRGIFQLAGNSLLDRKSCLRFLVGNKLQANEQATTADISDVWMITEALIEQSHQVLALAGDRGQQPVIQTSLDRDARRTGDGMADVGVAMGEC